MIMTKNTTRMSTKIDECKNCNDTTKTKKVTCFRSECSNEWTEQLNFRERMKACPTHHGMITECGGKIPALCGTCTSNGYYVDVEGPLLGFCAKYTVRKQ